MKKLLKLDLINILLCCSAIMYIVISLAHIIESNYQEAFDNFVLTVMSVWIVTLRQKEVS